MSTTYKSIERAANDAKNMGGTQMRIYFADWNDIQTHAAIGTVTNPEDKWIKTTAPVFKTDKSWQYIDVALHSGEYTLESIGEADGRAFNQKPVFAIPMSNEKALPLVNSPNGIWVFGIPLANGKTLIIGDDKFPAECIPAANGGTNKGNGAMFTFSVECACPEVFFYTGAFSLTPAS